MAIPRSQQINIEATPYYHCMNRCVRRTFLCGKDKETGQDYSHRKEWLVSRMKTLAEVFAIDIAAYAVMSNHYHLVLHVNEQLAANWSTEELRTRWSSLFPRDAQKLETMEKSDAPEQTIEEKLNTWRERLSSISWFMRCLNEPIARMSNAEDKLTGRFWEGRFKSQALLDEASLLSAMVYVDLNPIRAGASLTPEESVFTSIYDRIKAVSNQQAKIELRKQSSKTTAAENFASICNSNKHKQPFHLLPIKPINHQTDGHEPTVDIKLSDYIELVDFTGRHVREDKRGAIPDSLQPILDRLQVTGSGWLKMANNIEDEFVYAVGSKDKLAEFNKNNRQRMLRGQKTANECYLT